MSKSPRKNAKPAAADTATAADPNMEVALPEVEVGEIGDAADYKIVSHNTDEIALIVNGRRRDLKVGHAYSLSEGDVAILIGAGAKLERL